ncbi:hypothetical protein T265_04852 [Opisthorchis viverrini]|uniref:Reverse transcriptase domain-containing protein n=1 Tax=Opisthorchis viverrini TaxID=6198 RepID=A0A075AG04_OPIVI|nr:hypothetical protein T265_04852 [Opisthorchis viverrini]KER28249.1 hypothetical protein T265_04852 [Opisthorchis viverrini]
MRRTLDGFQNPGVQIVAGESLVDLEYTDHIALIFEDHSGAQALLNKLTTIIPSFGMHLAPSKCKVVLQNGRSRRSMKEITKRLGAVGATRLPGWGPRDPHCAWLVRWLRRVTYTEPSFAEESTVFHARFGVA